MTHQKLQKLQKGDYPPAHRLSVNVLLSNYHLFVIFAVLDVSCAVNSCINHSFFTFIFAVLLRFYSCYPVQSTWYGVRGPHRFWGTPVAKQPLPSLVLVITATYSWDCENSLYYRTSRDQPYKLLYKLMSSALFHKIWCIYLHPVRSYWLFLNSHNLKIQNGGSRHLVFWGFEFDYSGV